MSDIVSTYFTSQAIKQASHRLGKSIAHQRLVDFLIIKRALVLDPSNRVTLSTNNVQFIQSINEFMKCYVINVESEPLDAGEYPYINVFGTSGHSDLGYRSKKYPSNGTAVTVPRWREIVQVHEQGPRVISFRTGYEDHLEEKLHKAGDTDPLIADAAIWFFRATDLQHFISPEESTSDILGALVHEFEEETGLTGQEIEALFSRDLPVDAEEPTDWWISDVVASPLDYLPKRTIRFSEPLEEPGCSLDLTISLAAKGFVIITGPSGTGKSRSGLQLGQAIANVLSDSDDELDPSFELIPVGADWTDDRPILGYRNPFGPPRVVEEDTKNDNDGEDATLTYERYEVPRALRLLLRAADPERSGIPHILILDEMNLSHVERYFGPFLSIMEANRSLNEDERISLLPLEDLELLSETLDYENPSSLEATAAKRLVDAGRGLVYPDNLLIIGTVNVDETTYMFSPKVLDRAHVIELSTVQPSKYIGSEETDTENISPQLAVEILTESFEIRRSGQLDRTAPADLLDAVIDEIGLGAGEFGRILKTISTCLDGCYKILRPVGFPFGYRAINEIFAYLAVWFLAQNRLGKSQEESMESWPRALDKAIVQKAIPKIHGSRRQLGDSLAALEAFLGGNDASGSPPARYRLGATEEVAIAEQEALHLPGDEQMARSRSKLIRMHRQLSATGYTTFVE